MNQRVLVTAVAADIEREIIRANAILPGAVDGPRQQRVFEGRPELSGRTVEEEKRA